MIIAVYSAKGGVGKTTLAVNLAWASATLSSRRTLLWDLDAQGAASYILGQEPGGRPGESSITRDADPSRLIRRPRSIVSTCLPADESLRNLDYAFHDLGKRKRLAKIAANLDGDYDRIIIDCPPGLTDTSDQILRAADLAVVPVIPAVLSRRALDEIKQHVAQKKGPKVVLAPVFSMVDRRRLLHRSALESQPGWPVIPMASAYERMSEERAPIGELFPRSSPAGRSGRRSCGRGSKRSWRSNHPHRLLPLRPAQGDRYRRTGAGVGLPLPRLPEADRQRLRRPGALAGGSGHDRGHIEDLVPLRRQRQPDHPSISAPMRIDRSLCDRGQVRRTGRDPPWRLRRPLFSRAELFGLGRAQA